MKCWGLQLETTELGGCSLTHDTILRVRMGFYSLESLSSLLMSNMVLGPFSSLFLSLLLWLWSLSVSLLQFTLGGELVKNGS